MPGGGLHLASSEARRRDGLLRRNLHYILTAIVAVLASVALAVPSVYADPANNAVEEPAQTTAAASDVEPLAEGGGDNSWQIVKCGAENKDSEDCTQVSEDGNVRVHKWVTPTKTENVFDVHLSVDKRDDEISEVLNAKAQFENNKSSKNPDGTETCNGQCPIESGNVDFYYQIVYTDEGGKTHYSDVLKVSLAHRPDVVMLSTSEIQQGDIALPVWERENETQDKNKVGASEALPAICKVSPEVPGYDVIFGSVTKTISFGTDTSSAPVTDAMGEYILYEEGSALDSNASDGNSNVSFNSSNSTLSWTPVEKTGVGADDDGWLKNVAELQYTVTLDVTKDGFISSGLPTEYPNKSLDLSATAIYYTNASAMLNYTVTTTETTSGGGTESTTEKGVGFPKPQVRGLLYDLVATKTDGSQPLAGATFGLYNLDGDIVESVKTGTDGQIVFTGLPWGTYTVKEISAPEGYDKTDEPWTVTVCYTNNPSNLEDSTVDEILDTGNHAMVTKTGSFVHKKSTVSATIKVAKSLGGRTGEQGSEFTFTLTPKDPGTPMPVDESGNRMESMTATIDMNGKREGEALFTGLPIPAGKEGNYTYIVTENEGDVKGVVYSKAVYTVTVHADAQGKLTYTYTRTTDDAGNEGEPQTEDEPKPEDTALFVNGPTEFAGTQTLTKYLVGRNWQDGDSFTFRIEYTGSEPENSTPVPVPESLSPNGKVQPVGDKSNIWDVTLNYDSRYCEPKQDDGTPSYCDLFLGFRTVYPTDWNHHFFYYKVTERPGDMPGMLYSKAKYKLTAEVFRNQGFNEAGFGVFMRPTPVRDNEGNSPESSGPSTRAAIDEMTFINTFVPVSALPLTGGGSTARSLLLAGGGVLLVAGAAWLLARRRRA